MTKNNLSLKYYVFLIFICLSAITIFLYLKPKDRPQLLPSAPKAKNQETHNYAPSKIASGLNVFTSFGPGEGCIIRDTDGELIGHIKVLFCVFPKKGGLITSTHTAIHRYDAQLKKMWEYPARSNHHDLHYDEENDIVYFLDYHNLPLPNTDNKTVSADVINGLDKNGNLIFSWNTQDNIQSISKISGEPIEYQVVEKYRTADFKITNLNNIETVPKGLEEKLGPAFKQGNLLVTMLAFNMIVIIDIKTQKIVWHFKEENYGGQLHSANFTQNNEIVFFKNRANRKRYPRDSPYLPQSELAIIDPQTKNVIWTYNPHIDHGLYSKHYGHIHELPNGNLLVTHNPRTRGSSFEITRDKKIVWEWHKSIDTNSSKKPEVYKVQRINENLIYPVLDIYGQ